jgi:hypothetical protein
MKKLRRTAEGALDTQAHAHQIAVHREVARLRAGADCAGPKRLERHGFKAYSQSDEDGIVAEIFRRIGPGHKCFVEIGCGSGAENNTTYLLYSGWSGAWVDADPANAAKVENNFVAALATGRLRFSTRRVTAENVGGILAELDAPQELDLLSVDIDGNDYHVWNALDSLHPRVVVVEYNAKFAPPIEWAMPYDPAYAWDGTDRAGASLEAMTKLGARKGYVLVGCNITGANAFFVRTDEAGDHFEAPHSAVNHYHPLRPDLIPLPTPGHPPGAFVESAELD